MSRERPPGRIITFYSYKGGTGRSMALANLAWILAGHGKRVLAIDWDLEAPGLHRYFRPFLIDEELSSSEGLMDLIDSYASQVIRPVDAAQSPDPDWYVPYTDFSDYVVALNFEHFPAGGKIDLLPSGRQGDAYALAVSSFNWQNFYDRLGGGGFFEAVRERARRLYDYVLIDSRTGVSDTAGICSVQMPDSLVVCFTYNNQSIKGAAAVARSAVKRRQKLVQERSDAQRARAARGGAPPIEDTPRPYRIFPVPMRVDSGESDRLVVRQAFARDTFADLITHVGPSEVPDYWSGVEVPHKVFYSYEEVLAPFKDDAGDPKTVLAAFVRLARYLTDQEVATYRLPIAPDVRQRFLDAFAETPLTAEAKEKLARSQEESEEEALVRTAEAALGRLDEEERTLARRALGRLVRLGRAEEGGGIYPIRVNVADFSDGEKKVLSTLAYAGIVLATTESRPSAGGPVVPADLRLSIADERLVKVWKTLREWVDADHEFLTWRQQLRTYLADWERSARDRGALLSGRLLGEADLWLVKRRPDLNPLEVEYIEASRAALAAATTTPYQQVVTLPDGGTTAPMPPVVPPPPPPRRWWPAAVVVGALALSSAAWWWVWQRPGPSVPSPGPSAGPASAAPRSVQALLDDGDRAAATGDTEAAVAAYTTAAAVDPGSPAAFVRLGRIYDRLRDFGAASEVYDKALALGPNDPDAFFNRGISRTLQGDYKNAVEDFNHAIVLDGRNATYYFNRGVAQENVGDAARAIGDYTQAIRLKQDYAEPYLKRAGLYEKKENRAAARADYQSILTLNGDADTRKVAEVKLRSLGGGPPAQSPAPVASPARERALLHYYDPADEAAVQRLRGQLAKRLKWVTVAQGERVSAHSSGEVRYFFKEDAGLAEQLRREAESALAEQGYKVQLQIFYRDGRNFPNARPGTVEIWLPALTRALPTLS
jgi:tetratricopeptide (TPR) repeat protein